MPDAGEFDPVDNLRREAARQCTATTAGGACGVIGCTIPAHNRPFMPSSVIFPDDLVERIMERRNDAAFMERLRLRLAEDRIILSRLDDEHQCRYPQPNTAGFPVNQCLDCGGWIIAAPDLGGPDA